MYREILLSLCAVSLNACGSGDTTAPDADAPRADGGDASSATGATVSGLSISHSMNRLATMHTGRTSEYSNLSVEVVSVDALAGGGASAAALSSGPLNTSACGTMGGCPWSLGGVNLANISMGLAARLRDGRISGQVWVTTVTGFASPSDVAATAQSGRFEDGRAFAVSRDAIDTVVAPMVGLTGDQVMERGFIFGLVYNGRSADGSGQPVVGATVAASDASLRVVYPNSMFSGTASATANQGAFLAVPSAPGAAAATSFTVTPPTGQSLTWDSTRASVVMPGAVYFIPMYAR